MRSVITCAGAAPKTPAYPVTRLLAEIRELGYTGSANLLIRYLNQGRADAVRKPPSPRRFRLLADDRPTDLRASAREYLQDLLAACAVLTVLAAQVGEFAGLLTERRRQPTINEPTPPASQSGAHRGGDGIPAGRYGPHAA